MAIVRLEDVWKGYRLYRRPADRLKEVFLRRPLHETFWALMEVSLAVASGETFGIVGENGAGKSTLLKVIAGTSNPTRGRRVVTGRAAALLELGGAFHPELSGRENVFLMAAVHGVPKDRYPDYLRAVQDFSELDDATLDRPVKTYSSGMGVRLAYSCVTAVEPEILVVDEALSVGDLHFQKKSLDRMQQFAARGVTIVFCSHNLYQVKSLCERAAWIHEGRIRAMGPAESVITHYEAYQLERSGGGEAERPGVAQGQRARQGDAVPPVRIGEVSLRGSDGKVRNEFDSFDPLHIRVDLDTVKRGVPFHVGVAISRGARENVFGTSSHFEGGPGPFLSGACSRVTLVIPELYLLSGKYQVSVYVLDDTGLHVYDLAEGILPFTVFNRRQEVGIAYMPYAWRVEEG